MSSVGIFLLISLLMELQYVCSQPSSDSMEGQILYSNHQTHIKAYHQLIDQRQSVDKMESVIELTEDPESNGCNDTKRTGNVCRRCKEHYSLAIGSNKCIGNIECNDHELHLLLLIFFAAAGFLLVFFIKILNMTVSQGTINGLIFYANIVWAYHSIFFPEDSGFVPDDSTFGDKTKYFIFLKAFMAWVNLDFGIQTCFFKGLNFYWKTWLQFAFPLYVWAIAIIIIAVSRYSQRMTRVFGNNSVQVLATLLLLSHAKFLRTIISATLLFDYIIREDVYCDSEMLNCRGALHSILFGVAILVLVSFWLPYTLTLLFIQPLRKCSYFRTCRLRLMPFFDAYTGPFRPQNHFWVGLLCSVRGILLLVYTLIYTVGNSNDLVGVLALLITVMLLFLVLYCSGRLYKEPTRVTMNCEVSFLSVLEISFLLNLAALGFGVLLTTHTCTSPCPTQRVKAAIVYSSVGVAFLQFIGIFFWHIWKTIVPCIRACCRMRARNNYQNLEATETIAHPHTTTTLTIGDGPVMDNDAHIRESILTDGSHDT